ncbi:MAG: glutaredoxin domain-containing protein [Bdellovibrionota bacterium]
MKPIRIYTTKICPYCISAKRLLEARKLSYEEVSVSDPKARVELSEKSGMRTVPVIYIGEELVGGFTELDALDKAGRLMEMVGS